MSAAFEWTQHLGLCQLCERVFRLSRETWEISVATEPEWSDREREENFDFCLSCTTAESHPDEYVNEVGVLLGYDGNMAPEEDAEGNPILLGWWYGVRQVDGGDRVVTGPFRDAFDALQAAREVAR